MGASSLQWVYFFSGLAAVRHDQIVPHEQTAELARIFATAGAHVTTHWHASGRELGADDVTAAKQ